jgi:hypothetical protein
MVDASSIGPKTAARLRSARIFTVCELLDADPEEGATIVTVRYITAQAVRDRQDQARSVIAVPFLGGTHTQLLVGPGFCTYESVALADQATLMSAILKLATTREGQSIPRNGPRQIWRRSWAGWKTRWNRNQRGRPEPTRRSFCRQRYQRLHEALMERA